MADEAIEIRSILKNMKESLNTIKNIKEEEPMFDRTMTDNIALEDVMTRQKILKIIRQIYDNQSVLKYDMDTICDEEYNVFVSYELDKDKEKYYLGKIPLRYREVINPTDVVSSSIREIKDKFDKQILIVTVLLKKAVKRIDKPYSYQYHQSKRV